jgi:ferritin
VISKTIQDALNAQINAEQYSAQLYLAMSAYAEGLGFKGFGHWLRVQAGEETGHALKLLAYLLDRAGTPELKAISAPPADFGGVIPLFEKVLSHEQAITTKIGALFELARTEKDYASEVALQWYFSEQVEEEATARQVVGQLRAVGDKGGGVWYLDSRLAKRGKTS